MSGDSSAAMCGVCGAVRQQLVQGLERLACARQQQRLAAQVSSSNTETSQRQTTATATTAAAAAATAAATAAAAIATAAETTAYLHIYGDKSIWADKQQRRQTDRHRHADTNKRT